MTTETDDYKRGFYDGLKIKLRNLENYMEIETTYYK